MTLAFMAPKNKTAKAKQLAEAWEKKADKVPKPMMKKKKPEEPPVRMPKLHIVGPKTPPAIETPSSSVPPISPVVTPPPALSTKVVQAAISQYWQKKPSLSVSDDEELLVSKTEERMRLRSTGGKTIFAQRIVDEDEGQASEDGNASEEEKRQESPSQESEDDSDGSDELDTDSDNKPVVPPPPFTLKFSVPFEGANSTLKVSSKIKWQDLLSQLANTMSLPPKSVRIAYRFSIQPGNTPLRHLLSAVHLMELVAAAYKVMSTMTSKKDFVVVLKALGEAPAKGKGKADTKAEKKAKAKQKKRKYESESDSDGEGDTVDSKKIKLKKKSLTQFVTQLEKDNACAEHGGHGCIKCTNGHLRLLKQDLTAWAIFLQNGYPSTTTPPPKLTLGSGQPAPLKTTPATPAQTLIMPQAGMLPGMPPFGYPFPGSFPGQVWQPWLIPGPAFQTPQAPNAANHYVDMPSSPPAEIEDCQLFLCMGTWLQELDDGARGADEHNFAQYAPDFQRQKYVCIVDLEELKIEDVMCLIPEIPHGTATKILTYAKADIGRL
ncbi:hypothetical protein K438DRAFT_1948362 [Mycena galopus ATCC 62051]|nr:hypothetical protein K438DRAFT_1948362 [Mycena galopus ATCC 62051]